MHTGIDNRYIIAAPGSAYHGYITASIITIADIIIENDKYSGVI